MPLDELSSRISEICAAHLHLEGPLLPILHAVMAEFGCISEDAIKPIARTLNISRAEVHGVVSFYHDFRVEPAGRTVLKICRAEACQAMGGKEIGNVARDKLGIDWHGTTPDGAITLEPVYCLGLCACGPAAMTGTTLHGRLDADGLDAIIADAKGART